MNEYSISSFSGDYKFLSNFSLHGFTCINNKYWKTNEHFFQAMKTLDEGWREKIRLCDNPAEAKKLGRSAPLRPDWEEIRDNVMYQGLKYKFKQNPELIVKLKNTGNKELIEGNTWNDQYWGVCNGYGKNRLGELLMKLRDEL